MSGSRASRRRQQISLSTRVVAAFVLALICSASPAVAQPAADEDVAEVLKLDARRAAAFVQPDFDFLERITAAHYSHVETTGMTRAKTDFIDFLRGGQVRFLSFNIESNEARRFGDVVVLNGTYNNQIATAAGPQPVKRARHQRVYVRGDGGWQVVAHQATEIADQTAQ